VTLEIVVDGLGFPEGPVALADGSLAFVDLTAQRVARLDPSTGRTETIATVPGSPNGACLGAGGSIVVANNGGIGPLTVDELFLAPDAIGGCLQRVGIDGSVRTLTPPLPGPAPRRPNDVCLDAGGGLCFTDPVNWEVLPDRDGYRTGAVYRLDPDGSLAVLAEVGEFPNGIGIEPRTGDLIVAQTLTGTLLRFRSATDGYGAPEEWVELGAGSAPDGFCWAPDGTLVVAGSTSDAIHRVAPDGRVLEPLMLFAGSDPTNVCLAGEQLWITLGIPGAIARMPLTAALSRP
jgi:sugar lactone lactonase YvrE